MKAFYYIPLTIIFSVYSCNCLSIYDQLQALNATTFLSVVNKTSLVQQLSSQGKLCLTLLFVSYYRNNYQPDAVTRSAACPLVMLVGSRVRTFFREEMVIRTSLRLFFLIGLLSYCKENGSNSFFIACHARGIPSRFFL